MKLTNREAIEAQVALQRIVVMDLPVRISLDFALLSSEIDRQAKAYSLVRDTLIKNYKIKLELGDTAGQVRFSTGIKDNDSEEARQQKAKALEDFVERFNELMDSETGDIQFGKVRLPENVNIKPETLKPLLPFLEVE